jgi:hypothetical protein
VCAPNPKEARDSGFHSRSHHGRFRLRAGSENLRHASDPCWNGCHQERGREREAAARHVATDAPERLDPLLDRDARGDWSPNRPRELTLGDALDMAGGPADGPAHVGGHTPNALLYFVFCDFERPDDAIELARESPERAIPAGTDSIDDPTNAPIQLWIVLAGAVKEPVDCTTVTGVDNPEHGHMHLLLLRQGSTRDHRFVA